MRVRAPKKSLKLPQQEENAASAAETTLCEGRTCNVYRLPLDPNIPQIRYWKKATYVPEKAKIPNVRRLPNCIIPN